GRSTRRRRSPSRSCRRAPSAARARGAGACPAREYRERACWGGCSFVVSFEGNVVDQTRGADADGGSQDGRVEVRGRDVVDVEAGEELACALGVARRERARKGQGALALLRREIRVAGREGEPVWVANG